MTIYKNWVYEAAQEVEAATKKPLAPKPELTIGVAIAWELQRIANALERQNQIAEATLDHIAAAAG